MTNRRPWYGDLVGGHDTFTNTSDRVATGKLTRILSVSQLRHT